MSNHTFSQVPTVKVPRSIFRRNHNLKTTMGCDFLYPVYVDEALPGDTFIFKGSFFGRLSTPIAPIMDSLYLDTFFFAVPIRLLDDNFRKIMGERPFGDTTSEYLTPVLSTGSEGVSIGSLSDYLGIPTGVPNLEFCSYWHRAYNLIFNEWFRDENLVEPRPLAGLSYDGTQSEESIDDYVLMRRGKRHDYFTSCLPWPQKGDPVSLGIAGRADVFSFPIDDARPLRFYNGATQSNYLVQGSPNNKTSLALTNYASGPVEVGDVVNGTTTYGYNGSALGFTPNQALGYADLSVASATTISALRQAFALQSLLEVDARGGTRLIELIRAHFGIISPDARMQRPEYLGGSSHSMNVTSVPQTSGSTDVSPQGNLAAFVTASDRCHWTKSFTEHCVILGLANVRADLSYQQGLPRMFSRRTRYDYYWPELANLGEQAVLNKEIYAQGTSDDDEVFGYQERWAEYRYHPNMITGLFRSTAPQSLDYWHLAQKFESLPKLNSEFIEEHVPIERVVAVTSEPPIILDANFQVKCARPMPLYSVPSLGRRL